MLSCEYYVFFCLDIDECSEMAGACTQFCVNTLGSYICKCAEGYVKTADNRTCKKRDGRFYTFARCIHFYVTVLPRDAVHKCISAILTVRFARLSVTLVYCIKTT